MNNNNIYHNKFNRKIMLDHNIFIYKFKKYVKKWFLDYNINDVIVWQSIYKDDDNFENYCMLRLDIDYFLKKMNISLAEFDYYTSYFNRISDFNNVKIIFNKTYSNDGVLLVCELNIMNFNRYYMSLNEFKYNMRTLKTYMPITIIGFIIMLLEVYSNFS